MKMKRKRSRASFLSVEPGGRFGRLRNQRGQVLVAAVVGIGLIIAGVVGGVLLLSDTGAALFYEEKLIAVASQVATENPKDASHAMKLATDLFSQLDLKTNNLSSAVNDDQSINVTNTFPLLETSTTIIKGDVTLTGTSIGISTTTPASGQGSAGVLVFLTKNPGADLTYPVTPPPSKYTRSAVLADGIFGGPPAKRFRGSNVVAFIVPQLILGLPAGYPSDEYSIYNGVLSPPIDLAHPPKLPGPKK